MNNYTQIQNHLARNSGLLNESKETPKWKFFPNDSDYKKCLKCKRKTYVNDIECYHCAKDEYEEDLAEYNNIIKQEQESNAFIEALSNLQTLPTFYSIRNTNLGYFYNLITKTLQIPPSQLQDDPYYISKINNYEYTAVHDLLLSIRDPLDASEIDPRTIFHAWKGILRILGFIKWKRILE